MKGSTMQKRLVVEDSVDEERGETKVNNDKGKKKGGKKTLPFILATDLCDRFASNGLSNLITYMILVLNLPLVKASNIITIYIGTSNLTAFLGGLIADSFAGRFWTILISSIIYQLGLLSLTISTILPKLRPPQCPTQENCIEASNAQLWVLCISLILITIGSGGIRPCVVTFAADQFDMSKAKTKAREWNFFNLYYFCMAVAPLSAVTIVVYIQDNVSWAWGIGIPTIAMTVSFIFFLVGSLLYTRVKPAGSPLTRVIQVIVAAVRKRNVSLPTDPSKLYQNKEIDAGITLTGRLLHSNQFKWLDRAAIVTSCDLGTSNQPKLWHIATIQRVEELKSIIRIVPILASGILLFTSNSQLSNFTIKQALTMDRHMFKTFEIPPASMSIFSSLTTFIGLGLYDRLLIPFAKRFSKNVVGITCLQRLGIGFTINIFASIVSALIEIKRKYVAKEHNLLENPSAIIPVSVFWLVPQFCVHGVADVFVSVGIVEFVYDQSPESMRSTIMAFAGLPVTLGNYGGALLVTLVHNYTGKQGNWIPNSNLNKGRLENFYFLVSVIQIINLVYFVICACCYTYKPLEEIKNESGLEVNEDDTI